MRHFIVDRVAVVGSIGCHRTDRALDLVQQIREVRNVADTIPSQFAVESSRLLAAEARALGTYHDLHRKHVDTYLDEFVFRYDRRFYRHVSFETVPGLAAHHSSRARNEQNTYPRIVSSRW